jgi:hypothetical protein
MPDFYWKPGLSSTDSVIFHHLHLASHDGDSRVRDRDYCRGSQRAKHDVDGMVPASPRPLLGQVSVGRIVAR